MKLHDHEATPLGRAFLWGGIVLGVILMLLLVTGGFGLFGKGVAAAAGDDAMVRQGNRIIVPEHSPLRDRLAVAPARAQGTAEKLVLPGIVESDPAATAVVLSPVAGRVLEIEVALGDRVRRGQVLAVIDSPDLAQAFDDNDRAADALQLADKNLERQEGQVKLGTASTRDLDQARSDRTQAASEYARTQTRLRVLGAPADSKTHSRGLSVTAPVSGSVTALNIARGNMLNDPTQPLMTVADLSTVWVTALAPEKDVAQVAKGQDAEVQIGAYPDKVLHGKVLFVSDVIEADSRRNKLRIAFPNADTAPQAEYVRNGDPGRDPTDTGHCPDLGASDEQRPHDRLRGGGAVDVRASNGGNTVGRRHDRGTAIGCRGRGAGGHQRRNPSK